MLPGEARGPDSQQLLEVLLHQAKQRDRELKSKSAQVDALQKRLSEMEARLGAQVSN